MNLFTQFRSAAMFVVLCLMTFSLSAQVAPQAEPVYGGYIEWIDNMPLSATDARVFVSTMSANSMFWAEMQNINTTSPTFTGWQTVPDIDHDDGYGNVRGFAVEENSGFVFAGVQGGGVIAADHTPGSRYDVASFMVEAIEAHNSRLFIEIMKGPEEWMMIGDVDASGNVIAWDSCLIATSPGWTNRFNLRILINPYNNHVYFFVPGDPPIIYKSSDPYTTLSNASTFSAIPITDLVSTGNDYVSMGIAPDGRLFVGSYEGNSSGYTAAMSYTDFDGDPWTTVSMGTDCGRGAISIGANSSGSYTVHFSRAYSTDKGVSWNNSGAADGAICIDPVNGEYAYVRTDWGIGLFEDYTTSVIEINTGLLAVQVNDFDMDALKNTAWVASKSGIWHVNNYSSTSPIWSNPIWPQWSSVPYTEVESTETADTVYCGNNDGDVFRHESALGSYSDPMAYDRIFEARDDAAYPLWNWTYSTHVSAVGIDPDPTRERIFIGLYDMEDWDEPVDSLGAVFVGEYFSGGGWTFDHIIGSPIPNTGLDVNDLVVVEESGNTVLYVGVERNTTYGTVNGIYRMEETSPGNWSISNDLFLSPSYPISATIVDLVVSDNDTIFACGTDASGSSVVSYKKAVGATYWEALPQSGLTPPNTGRAITYDDVNYDVYMAVDNELFMLSNGATAWTPYYTYPFGTHIQFIYYDELLVGTETGLFVHNLYVGQDEIPMDDPERFVKILPNPFNTHTSFQFTLEDHSRVKLEVYDINGKLVDKLYDGALPAGDHQYDWKGSELPPGVYFYRLKVDEYYYTGKIIKE